MTLGIDNLVPLNEQQFVDSVSQRADELKTQGHESLSHFSPNTHSSSQCDVSALFVF